MLIVCERNDDSTKVGKLDSVGWLAEDIYCWECAQKHRHAEGSNPACPSSGLSLCMQQKQPALNNTTTLGDGEQHVRIGNNIITVFLQWHVNWVFKFT